MQTWVIRQMGAAWDPERFCPYTGKRIFPHPSLAGENRRLMFYFREDGETMRCRELTERERAWLDANPAAFAEVDRKFQTWLSSVRK